MVRDQAPSFTIGGLARAAHVGVETVRFYQRLGLLAQPERTGGARRYADAHLRRLRFIRAAQRAGFTLAEAGELLTLDPTRDRLRARALAEARIAALDERIAQLAEARAALARLAHRCDVDSDAACPIIATFEAGGG